MGKSNGHDVDLFGGQVPLPNTGLTEEVWRDRFVAHLELVAVGVPKIREYALSVYRDYWNDYKNDADLGPEDCADIEYSEFEDED